MRFRSDLERLALYHSWSRGRFLDLYAGLPWKVLVRNREATYGSIRNVHLHILQVYASWLVPMFGRRSLRPVLRALDPRYFDRVRSVARLRELDRLVDREFLEVCRRASSGGLPRKHWFTDRGRRFAFTEEEGLWHMIEEDFLHRGEIICMLWQDDIAPPNTSYMLWRYEEDPKRHAYMPFRFEPENRRTAGGRTRAPRARKPSR